MNSNLLIQKFIHSGDEYYSEMISLIQNAKQEIILEVYIFDYDEIGRRILGALNQAAARGVRVFLIVDGIGSIYSLKTLRNETSNLSFAIYHAPPIGFRNLTSWLRQLRVFFSRANKRNHRKIFIADQETALIGSYNIARYHTDEFTNAHAWKDLAVKVSGGDLIQMRDIVLKTWRRARRFHVKSKRNIPGFFEKIEVPEFIRLNFNRKTRSFLRRDLRRKLNSATQRIYIANAYFLPSRSLLKTLNKAAKRGVETHLILPAVSDVPVVRWASRLLYERLIRNGVKIYEYQTRVFHSKYMIIDAWGSLGSQNLNHRSLFHDLEVEVEIRSPEDLIELEYTWQTDLLHAKEITLDSVRFGFKTGDLIYRALGAISFAFRFWL